MTQVPGPDRTPQPGSRRPTAPAVVAAWAVVGLALGWLVHPVAERVGAVAPVVSWTQPLGLLLVAALLGAVAHATWRSVHVRRERMELQQALNRLVLARACAYVGGLAAGGYLGYALSWLGSRSELADERLLRSAVAAVCGLVVVVAALLLERACRVRKDPDPT